jgi:hypothetical protein
MTSKIMPCREFLASEQFDSQKWGGGHKQTMGYDLAIKTKSGCDAILSRESTHNANFRTPQFDLNRGASDSE